MYPRDRAKSTVRSGSSEDTRQRVKIGVVFEPIVRLKISIFNDVLKSVELTVDEYLESRGTSFVLDKVRSKVVGQQGGISYTLALMGSHFL